MRAVIQRVSAAAVEVDGETVGSIGAGLCVLAGAVEGDGPADADWTADKLAHLRIFPDDAGKMNRSLADLAADARGAEDRVGVLLVPNFTLAADARKGRRPSFDAALHPDLAAPLVDRLAERLASEHGLLVERGVFGAHMRVTLANDGPVTIVLDSADRSGRAAPPTGSATR